MTASHAYDCDWQLDQYDFECTCGLTRPKAEGQTVGIEPLVVEFDRKTGNLRHPAPPPTST